jgi:hypothetical protein
MVSNHGSVIRNREARGGEFFVPAGARTTPVSR